MFIGLGILLFGAFTILFGGEPNNFLLTQIESYAEKEIVDKERKKLVVAEFKEVKKIVKEYNKTNKKNAKELDKLVSDRDTKLADYQRFYKLLADYERKVNETYIPHRVTIQNAITHEEWDAILEDAKKDFKKSKKSINKKLKWLKKIQVKIQTNVLKHVDEKNKAIATKELSEFNDLVYVFGEDILNYDPAEEKTLMNKNATQNDLLKVIDSDIQKWLDILNAFAKQNTELAKVVQEDEWNAVAKELSKYY